MAVGQGVEVRWLAGLGSCPGAVDLTVMGPSGPITRAVTLPEAMTAAAVIDGLCQGSQLSELVRQVAPDASKRHDEGDPR